MTAKACMNTGAGTKPAITVGTTAPNHKTTQHTMSVPVVFPNLTGKSNPPARGSLPLQKCHIVSDLVLSVLQSRCESLNVSIVSLSQSIWARLLSQYTGEPEVSFGAFALDSPLPEQERGACLCRTWRESAYAVDVAFAPGKTDEDIRRELEDVSRDNSKDTYETVISVYASEHETSHISRAAADTNFVVHLEVVLNTRLDQVQVTLHYDPAFVNPDSALLIAREFLGTLAFDSLTTNTTPTRFSNLQPEILSICQPSGNAPIDIANKNLFIHHLFEKHAEDTPEKICLEFLQDENDEVEAWSFKQLNETSNRLAHLILKNGISRDEAVPVCLDKGPWYYACILACMKAGVPFTPIDPVAPVKRKAFMIEELQARVVLSIPEHFKQLCLSDNILILDISDQKTLQDLSSQNPQISDLTERCLAYRLYTSGSTGQPKAVSLEVGAVVHAIQKSINLLPLHRDTRLLQFAAITFDMCYFDCFLAWTVGFTLISASKRYLLGELEATVKRLRISFLDLTPSVAATLNANELEEVEMLYCIGEAMPTKIVEDWEGRCVNSYGPTEAAMLCTITNAKKSIKSANVGQPFDGMSLYILNKEQSVILPRMAAGELCICGPQLAREYHRNEAKTASSFITLDSGLRLYRTGDLARMLADGTFEFIGRKDDQVKLRGFRIELGEVSAVLRDVHPLVKDQVALVLKHSEEEKEQLVAFLAFASRKNRLDPPSIQECEDDKWKEVEKAARKAAEAALPSYMLPHIYFPLNWIPLSAAAKVDKRSLGDLFKNTDISSLGKKPETGASKEDFDEVSSKIRDVFAEASNSDVSTIGLDTTIYQLGLDSISALMVARALKAISINASVLDIIEYPTIRGLRSHILGKKNPVSAAHHQDEFALFNQQHISSICSLANVPREQIENVLPCSPMQEGILTQFLQTKGSLYYNAILFQLEGNVNIDRLLEAWKQVTQLNDMLRTGFVEFEADGGHYAMMTHKTAPMDSLIQKVETATQIERFVQKLKKEKSRKALSDTSVPPWSVTLVPGAGTSYMIFTALHTIYDAQTLQILLSDVNQLYNKKTPAIHPTFVPILREMLCVSQDKTKVEVAADYWKSVLQDCPILKFPIMTPLREDEGEPFASYRKCASTMKNVEELCKKFGFSLGAIGQATWAKILGMYFGELDICFGSVVSGRTGTESAEDVVFPCLTTIPMRAQLTGTNKDFVARIQERLSRALKYQHTPLRAIQRALGNPEQSLFDTIFVYQRSNSSMLNKSRQLWWELDAEATVEYPVSFEIEPTGDGYLGLRLTGRTDIIPKEQMDLMISQFEYCLMHLLHNQDADVMDLGDVPRKLMSNTPAEFEKLPCNIQFLHDFVSSSTRLHPDKVALEFATAIQGSNVTKQSWTYRQFNDMGNKIASFLLQQGAAAGDLVGICFDKTPEAYFGIFGILKAGCAFVALDFSAPIQRKTFIIQDAKIKLVLTMARFEKDFDGISGLRVHPLDNLRGLTKYFSNEEPEIEGLTPEHLSYVLYTSGTTGTPKGCRITHENAVQAMLSFQTLFKGHWDENSRFLQFASLHFDVSVLEQYWSWSVGVCLTSAPRDIIFQDLGNAIRALEITHIDLTPSLAGLITPEDCPSLCRGVFITGGEKLKQDVLDIWGETNIIHNGYGPTEATIGVTMYPRVPRNGRPSNIGPQFVNVGSMVLKPKTNIPVLRGAVGELCVTGALVGDGYLNREDLTKERFPYVDGKRMYRTGDLVRQLHNGCFDYLGRADDQVKLRGQRLELGEINETIRNSDKSVAEVATLVCQHGEQQVQQLVSFVSFRSKTKEAEGRGSPTSAELLKDFPASRLNVKILQACQSRLPVYMVPTYILPVTKLPLTVNNKVDERTLRTIFKDTSLDVIQNFEESKDNEDGEFSSIEDSIREVLDQMAIDSASATKNTSLFRLGLDSVSIVSFSNKLRKKGFQSVEVSQVMQNPTIAALAKVLSNSEPQVSANDNVQNALQKIKAFSVKHSFEVSSELGLNDEEIESISPCTPLQEGMIARALNTDAPLYYNTFCFKVSQNTTSELLRAAWQKVVDQTDILRTCFCETSDGIAQVVLRKSSVKWSERNLRANEDLIQHAQHGLSINDLATPPVSLELLMRQRERYLRLSIFHALYDGSSISMILNDFEKALSNTKLEKRMQFTEAIPRILSLDAEGAKVFWTEHLKGARFDLLQPRRSNAGREQTLSHVLEFSREQVEKVARDSSCTIQALFQTVCVQALMKLLERQVVIGVITSGRSFTVDGVDSCIGPLFNSIPCYLPVSEGMTWKKYAEQAHAFNIKSVPYHHSPLRQISKWIGKGSAPLFDILFVFQPAIPALEDNTLQEIQSSAVPDYPVALEVGQQNDGRYSISITTNSAYFDESENSLLLKSVATGLADLIAHPEQELSILREVEANIFESLSEGSSHAERSSKETSSKFTWTKDALVIRKELSILTGTNEEAITERSSIYQIGLDSVEAIRLSSRLQKKGIVLKVSDIMRESTIEKLVSFLGTLKLDKKTSESGKNLQEFEHIARKALESSALELDGVESILPTTPLQNVMIAESFGSDFALYFNHDVLELNEGLDLDRLQSAWKSVVQYNPILRTTFEESHNFNLPISTDYIQVVWKEMPLEWDVVKTTSEFESGRIDELIASHKSRKLPLIIGILQSERRSLMVLSISHALYDGRSMGLLIEDVAKAYNGQYTARPDYTPFLDNILNLNSKKDLRFWKQRLANVQPHAFPASESEGEIWKNELQSVVSAHEFSNFCRQKSVSEPVLGQACWSFLLSDVFSQDDIVFGTVMSGRDTEESEEYMFPTMNTIPIRAIIHGTIGEVLESMQYGYSQSLEHQFIALRDIQRSVCVPGQRIFDTLFVYQKNKSAIGSSAPWRSIGGASRIDYPIAIEIEADKNALTWTISASSHVMSAQEAKESLSALDNILQHVISYSSKEYQSCLGSQLGSSLRERLKKNVAEEKDDINGQTQTDSEECDALEETIIKAISMVSKTPETEIRPSTSIFHVGIDSISAIRLAAELRKKSIFTSVSEIMREKTVKKIAQFLSKKQHKTAQTPKSAESSQISNLAVEKIISSTGLDSKDLEHVTFATPGQLFLIKAWEASEGRIFLPTFPFRVSKSLDAWRLKRAAEKLLSLNPILRTTFVADGSELFQLVHKHVDANFDSITLKSDFVSETELRDLNQKEQNRAFDMSLPSVRFYLASAKKESYVFLTLHHALYDAFTMPQLLSQLSSLYNDEQSELPATVRSSLVLRSSSEAQEFWKNYFADNKSTLLPSKSSVPVTERIELYKERHIHNASNLDALCRKHGVSLHSLSIASFGKVLSKLVKSSSPILGIYLSNRHLIDQGGATVDKTMPTLNMVPLMVKNASSSSLVELARQVQEDLIRISTSEAALTNLSEIFKWTGIRIDTFVNFLKENESEGSGRHGGLFNRADVSTDPPAARDFTLPNTLRSSDKTIQTNLDLEMAVRNGSIDVGLFAAEKYLHKNDVRGVLDTLRNSLEDFN